MLGLGVVVYDLEIDAAKVPALIVSFLVGVPAFAAMGMAVAGLCPSASSASAVANADHLADGLRLGRLHRHRGPAAVAGHDRRHLAAQAVRAVSRHAEPGRRRPRSGGVRWPGWRRGASSGWSLHCAGSGGSLHAVARRRAGGPVADGPLPSRADCHRRRPRGGSMHPELTDEHEALRAVVREFAESEVEPYAAGLGPRPHVPRRHRPRDGRARVVRDPVPRAVGGGGDLTACASRSRRSPASTSRWPSRWRPASDSAPTRSPSSAPPSSSAALAARPVRRAGARRVRADGA